MRDNKAFALRCRMEAEAGAEQAEIMLYGEIIDNVREEFKYAREDQSAADFDRMLKRAKGGGAKKLLLRINSPGGYLSEAVAMRSALANSGFEDIVVRIEGLCASAATIPATLPGARVEIAEGSEYMIHNPWVVEVGTADDLEKTAKHMREEQEQVVRMYAERSGQAEDMVRQWMDEETWFQAEDAVRYGFADEVIRTASRAEEPALYDRANTGAMMRAMYRHTPERVLQAMKDSASNAGAPAAEINGEDEEHMELKELTIEQLQAGAPELYASICAQGAQMERERLNEIDELTPPGYEELAAQAKESGETALAYHKRVIKAQKEKAAEYLKARAKETEPAAKVEGGTADDVMDEAEKLKALAKEIAGMAAGRTPENGMY